MRLDESEQSENLEDVRGSGGFGGGMPIPGGRGGLGIGTIVVLGLIGYALGIDPRILIGGAELLSGGGDQVTQQAQQEPQPSGAPTDESHRFISAVLANTEKVWGEVLPQQTGKSYPPPKLVLYSNADLDRLRPRPAHRRPVLLPARSEGLSRSRVLRRYAAAIRRQDGPLRHRLCGGP